MVATWGAFSELTNRRQQSAASMIGAAAERLDIEPDELVDRAQTSTATAQLLADALLAPAQTFNKQKVGALARALANGLRDDQARPG